MAALSYLIDATAATTLARPDGDKEAQKDEDV